MKAAAISNIAMRTRIPHRRFRGFRDDTAGLEGGLSAGWGRSSGRLASARLIRDAGLAHVGVDPARSKAGEHGRINTRKRQGVIASGSIATRFSSLVEHDPSGQARGISMLFPKPVLTSGSNALLQRRAARSREWVDRSPVGGVSGDLVVLEGLQNAAGGHARAVAHNRGVADECDCAWAAQLKADAAIEGQRGTVDRRTGVLTQRCNQDAVTYVL